MNQPTMPDKSTQAPTSDRQSRFSGTTLLATLLISMFCWLVIGDIAYSDWINHGNREGTAVISYFVAIAAVGFFLGNTAEARLAWPDRSLSRFIGALAGSGISTLYCIVSTGWANNFQRVFWSLGGIYMGALIEVVTGFWHRCMRELGSWEQHVTAQRVDLEELG